jgi:hypothetical protein
MHFRRLVREDVGVFTTMKMLIIDLNIEQNLTDSGKHYQLMKPH